MDISTTDLIKSLRLCSGGDMCRACSYKKLSKLKDMSCMKIMLRDAAHHLEVDQHLINVYKSTIRGLNRERE